MTMKHVVEIHKTLMELDGFTSGFQSFNHAVPTILQLSSTHWRT